MDKTTLESLKNAAAQRCQQWYDKSVEANTELERSRGDFRTYESLLLNWQEPLVNQVAEAEIVAKKSKKKEKV